MAIPGKIRTRNYRRRQKAKATRARKALKPLLPTLTALQSANNALLESQFKWKFNEDEAGAQKPVKLFTYTQPMKIGEYSDYVTVSEAARTPESWAAQVAGLEDTVTAKEARIRELEALVVKLAGKVV